MKNLNGNDKEMIASQEQSFVASRIGDAVFVHSEQSDNLFEISESAVIVEDVTDVVPPEVPSPSTIVPLVEDDPSDENSSPRETDTESCAPESDYEVFLISCFFRSGNDKPMNLSLLCCILKTVKALS